MEYKDSTKIENKKWEYEKQKKTIEKNNINAGYGNKQHTHTQ